MKQNHTVTSLCSFRSDKDMLDMGPLCHTYFLPPRGPLKPSQWWLPVTEDEQFITLMWSDQSASPRGMLLSVPEEPFPCSQFHGLLPYASLRDLLCSGLKPTRHEAVCTAEGGLREHSGVPASISHTGTCPRRSRHKTRFLRRRGHSLLLRDS